MSRQFPGNTIAIAGGQKEWLRARPQEARAQEFQEFTEAAPPYSESADQVFSRLDPHELHRNTPYGFPETNPHRMDHDSSQQPATSGSQTWNHNPRFEQQSSSSYPPPPTQGSQAIALHQPTPYYAPQLSQGSQALTLPASASPESAEAALLSKTLAFINTVPPPPSQPSQLFRPILIPQIPPPRGLVTPFSPFIRAWAPCLSSSNLTIDHFLAFIDNLNVISLPSPPLQVLNMAGNVVGLVPHHWAQLASAGMNIGAGVGTKIVSKVRIDSFLKQVNARVFEPRRMRVRIMKGEDIPRRLRMTEAQATLDDGWDPDLLEKVLKNVEPFSAQIIRHELPVPEGQKGFLDKWSAKALEKEKAKNAKKLMKQREKQMEKEDKKERKEEKKSIKAARKQEEKQKKGKYPRADPSDSESSDSDSRHIGGQRRNGRMVKTGKAREQEEKAARKLLWIMIENI